MATRITGFAPWTRRVRQAMGFVRVSTCTYVGEIDDASGTKGTTWERGQRVGRHARPGGPVGSAKFKLDLTTLTGTASGPPAGSVAGSSSRWRIFDAATLALPEQPYPASDS